MREELRRLLTELGASDDEIDRAAERGWLPLLAFERALLPGKREYDLVRLAAVAGITEEFARRLWRAVGFPDVPADLAVFTERDVAAARLAFSQAPAHEVEEGTLLQQIRVISGALARVAAVEASGFSAELDQLHASGRADDDIALAVLSDNRLAEAGMLIDYVHRLQLRAAVWRRAVLTAEPDIAVAVGFADLAGYTELSARLDPASLSELVARWEGVAYDTIAAHGARVVKTIGDEVMFVGLTRETVVAALALRDAALDEGLPALRVGLAAGAVVALDGDYFGPVVNLASRLTELARPGELLAPAELHQELLADGRDGVRGVSRGVLQVRSVGPVEVFALEHSG
ncbi:MAG TPA: adenylate/guanylate cyclase domain-containing protein [Acidimicrobiia bacterium]|nr:adenylate/guanylate cyclase domain-containing protein [Acidimicrobiia bacterium]